MEGWYCFKFLVVAFIMMLVRNAPEVKKLKETNFRNRIQIGINNTPIFSGFFILFYFIFVITKREDTLISHTSTLKYLFVRPHGTTLLPLDGF
jgi:hypothetical protein